MHNFCKLVIHDRNKGLTLVESLIALTVLSILVAVALPYSTSWGDYAKVSETESLLFLGYGKARALALQNPAGATGNAAASSIELETGVLLVCEGASGAAGCTAGGGSVTWSQAVPEGVTINLNGAAMTGHNLDNTGQSIDGSGNTITLTYSITRGDEEFTDVLR